MILCPGTTECNLRPATGITTSLPRETVRGSTWEHGGTTPAYCPIWTAFTFTNHRHRMPTAWTGRLGVAFSTLRFERKWKCDQWDSTASSNSDRVTILYSWMLGWAKKKAVLVCLHKAEICCRKPRNEGVRGRSFIIIECLFSINDFKLSIKLYRVTLNILLVKEEGALFVLVRVRVLLLWFWASRYQLCMVPFLPRNQ